MKGVFDKSTIRKWDIYLIANPSGQSYVGCTCRFKNRMKSYKNGRSHKQPFVHESLLKFGYDSHEIRILDTFHSNYEEAQGKEIFWIRSYMSNSAQWPNMNGLNKTIGGGIAPHIQTPEARLKARKTLTPELLKKRGEKISKSKMGHTHSPEAIEKIRQTKASQTGKPICAYNLDGELLREYSSIEEAIRSGIAPRNTILYSLYGKSKRPRKLYFKYKK